MCRDKMNCSTR